MKVYQPFLKCKNYLNQIQVKTYSYPFEIDEAEEYEMQQFSLLCKPRDLHVTELLKAASNEDFPLKPRFGVTLLITLMFSLWTLQKTLFSLSMMTEDVKS